MTRCLKRTFSNQLLILNYLKFAMDGFCAKNKLDLGKLVWNINMTNADIKSPMKCKNKFKINIENHFMKSVLILQWDHPKWGTSNEQKRNSRTNNNNFYKFNLTLPSKLDVLIFWSNSWGRRCPMPFFSALKLILFENLPACWSCKI